MGIKKNLYFDKYRWKDKKFPYLLPQYRFVFWKRQCENFSKIKPIYLIVRIIYEHFRVKYLIDIPAKCKIGKGFRIEHIGNIIVNPQAVIGNNCTIFNGVVIGSASRKGIAEVPVISDSVYIGANSIIVGAIKVGQNVLIAPGSYINFDVPDNSIVLGNPGKIIPRENATEGYMINSIEKIKKYTCDMISNGGGVLIKSISFNTRRLA